MIKLGTGCYVKREVPLRLRTLYGHGMKTRFFPALWLVMMALPSSAMAEDDEPRFTKDLDVSVPSIATDKSVRYDYDIVYVRAQRAGDEKHKRFYTDFSQPVTMEPGADLMLLHPDGKEELLAAGGEGSITDPVVSFDGQWVYYSHLYDLQNPTSGRRQGRARTLNWMSLSRN